ncbi:hypothetical protein [Neobacillus sp. Marseille-QA0830]
MLTVLIITIITTQSTTGYMGLAVLLLFYLTFKRKKQKGLYSQLMFFVIACAVTLFIDYSVRGENSLLYSAIIFKVFNTSGGFDLSATTGEARMGTILLCIRTMLTYPFGIGYDSVHELLNVKVTGYLAAQIMQTGAALGILPFIIILIWIFIPIIKSNIKSSVKILFVILYFNTALAQSREFYPVLIIIPIWVHLYSYKNLMKEST